MSPELPSKYLPVGHPTSVVFLDETGVVHHHPNDSYFGIGCLKTPDPALLSRGLRRLRDQSGIRDELHWADFDKAATRNREDLVDFAKRSIDLLFDTDDVYFCCRVADRGLGDLTRPFRNHRYPEAKAYERLAARVLEHLITGDEVVTVLADYVSTPPEVQFERDVAAAVNAAHGRLALASVTRLDSKGHDGLQLVDLLVGAATFDLRRGDHRGESQKQELLDHLLDRCGCASFRPNGRCDPDGTKYDIGFLTPPRRPRRGRRG